MSRLSKLPWVHTSIEMPRDGIIVDTKVSTPKGDINEAQLKHSDGMWLYPDGTVCYLYTPTEFKRLHGSPFGNQDVSRKPMNALRMPAPPKMTKAEEQYGRILQTQYPYRASHEIMFESISFRLRNGTRYTPDWVVFGGAQIVLVVEVKGSFRLGSAGTSAMKVKDFVVDYPMIPFRHVQKQKDGWYEQNFND